MPASVLAPDQVRLQTFLSGGLMYQNLIYQREMGNTEPTYTFVVSRIAQDYADFVFL